MDKKTTVFLAKKLFTELVFNTAYIPSDADYFGWRNRESSTGF